MSYAIICHLFYPSIATELLYKLAFFNKLNATFYINVQGTSDEHSRLQAQIPQLLNNAIIINTPNKGRDIGAKLLLIDLMIRLSGEHEYTLIIHDKKSPHLEDASLWRETLNKVIAPSFIKKTDRLFKSMPSAGILCAAEYIQNEYVESSDIFMCNSNPQIKEHLKEYSIHTTDYNFVGGNIFWIRTHLLKSFFSKRSALKIRGSLETGNALDFSRGTYIHAWERIMSWIATSQGYKINGI
jgi:lipopolysaccharide biosynthesis protein